MLGLGPGEPCPPTPPPPDGYRVWNEQSDGRVPADAVKLAASLAFGTDVNGDAYSFGHTETICVNQEPLIVRVDPHTWSHDPQGNLITGCFHGATVYRPIDPMACPSSEPVKTTAARVLEGIVLASAVFGTTFTIVRSYFEHKYARQAYEENIRREIRGKLQAKAVRNPYTPDVESWPVYEYRITPTWYSMSRKQSGGAPTGYLVLEMEKLPGQQPEIRVVRGIAPRGSSSANGVTRSEAISAAMERAQRKILEDPRNPNPVRVLDEKGRVVYVRDPAVR